MHEISYGVASLKTMTGSQAQNHLPIPTDQLTCYML
jgi:hypothetical protein